MISPLSYTFGLFMVAPHLYYLESVTLLTQHQNCIVLKVFLRGKLCAQSLVVYSFLWEESFLY